MVHLTFTGVNAGMLLCGESREKVLSEGNQVNHAVYAPLNKADFRGNCCAKCLREWALSAYEDDEDEEMPEWVKEERRK